MRLMEVSGEKVLDNSPSWPFVCTHTLANRIMERYAMICDVEHHL